MADTIHAQLSAYHEQQADIHALAVDQQRKRTPEPGKEQDSFLLDALEERRLFHLAAVEFLRQIPQQDATTQA